MDSAEEFEVFADIGEHRVRFYRCNHFVIQCENCGKTHISPSFDENTADAQRWAIGRLLSSSCEKREPEAEPIHDINRPKLESFK